VSVLIPKIIHQTWKTHQVPENCLAYVETWKKLHPEWEYKLWSDQELEKFVALNYPDFLPIFRGYGAGVQRADAGRYLLLDHFGGVYSDIDTECLVSFDGLCDEDRIVFCTEPQNHFGQVGRPRGFKRLIFNGTMASPKNRPFWAHLVMALEKNRAALSVLDSTGPYILSRSVETYQDQPALSISSAHLFCGREVRGTPLPEARFGDYGDRDMSVHHWMGSWYLKEKYPFTDKIESYVRSWIYNAKKGPQYKPVVDPEILKMPLQKLTGKEEIAVLIPVRDGVPFLERCLELLNNLDWPKKQLHVAFCEGDSVDGTAALISQLVKANSFGFASFRIIHKLVGTVFERDLRWLAKLQKSRRGGLAQVRNHLIDNALPATVDWALWIDVDVNNYPRDVLRQLLALNEKIVVPHCVRDDGTGITFDQNSFATVYDWRDTYYFKKIVDGLYQPPPDCFRRIRLQDVRYLDRISLNGVGGTMLLVHASVHRAGVRFPQLPYKDLIETEAFGQLARDHGITPVGLPNLLITHPA
jgi:hypothetical protein